MRRGNVPRSWYRLWYAYVVRPFEWMEVTWLLRLHTVPTRLARGHGRTREGRSVAAPATAPPPRCEAADISVRQERLARGSATGGDGGGRVPPILRVRGIIPPIFRKIVGQIRWVFGFWYGLPSEENPGFAAAWSPSPPFSSAWRSPWGWPLS